ncbi:DUF4189 domain-containing protein [Xanthomonas campestris]|uniref:DUF4189 domain-containing protein n=1 Tax=Xanthomonas campestris TaxID=339 RepID=UPI0023EA364D|nr:hypothetical protein [Xanthomonas campestris]
MKLRATAFIFLLFLSHSAMAEQGCPPGQYPIGGQGAIACAPMPQGQTQQAQPSPVGKWVKTWGAVVLDESEVGALGVSTGKLSKNDAQQAALLNCAKVGGTACREWTTYRNQCIAVAEPYSDGRSVPGSLQFVTGPSSEKNNSEASRKCSSTNKISCRVIYSACSEPIFEKF